MKRHNNSESFFSSLTGHLVLFWIGFVGGWTGWVWYANQSAPPRSKIAKQLTPTPVAAEVVVVPTHTNQPKPPEIIVEANEPTAERAPVALAPDLQPVQEKLRDLIALAVSDEVELHLRDGRVVRARPDQGTDSKQIWITEAKGGTRIRRRIPWTDVSDIRAVKVVEVRPTDKGAGKSDMKRTAQSLLKRS